MPGPDHDTSRAARVPDSATTAGTAARLVPWVARLAWALTLVGGGAVEGAVDGRSGAVAWTTAIGAWTIWGVVVAALLIPSTWSLTVGRTVGFLGVPVVVATIVGGAEAIDVALLAAPLLVALAVFASPEFGRWMVQASAYGDEERFPLRPPVAAGAAAIVTWLVWAAAITIGPLALAAGNLLVGIPLVVLAGVGTVLLLPRWHRMARRWLVLVPAGLVVHDPVVLADTVMLRTDQVGAIGLAEVGTGAADLTGPASGYAVEVTATETVTTVFAFTPQEPNGRAIHMTAFLVAPSRPGAALRAAAARRLPVR